MKILSTASRDKIHKNLSHLIHPPHSHSFKKCRDAETLKFNRGCLKIMVQKIYLGEIKFYFQGLTK
jgi:hypothetical protein